MKRQRPVDEISIVVFPSHELSALLKTYKQLLKKYIPKGYGSDNSAAHVTIIQFKTYLEFTLFADQIREFCKTLKSQNVTFNSWGKFKNTGTFYLAPNNLAKIYIDSLIIDIHRFLHFPIDESEVNAHMTIGRKLFEGKMEIAEKIFMNINPNLTFNCHALYVRKFNGRQYSEIIETISFGQ